MLKNVLDRAFAATLLLVGAPLLIFLVVAVKTTSRGPVLFRQTRYGRGKKPFDIYKFRSMYSSVCDARVAATINQATQNDPRVTPLGRVLRRTSLDELPQLLNVLSGDMSIVGPRPHAVAEDDYFATVIADYDKRFRMKPGITGFAQVIGLRGEITSDEFMSRRLAADNRYIDEWSNLQDLRILLKTIVVIFEKEQAY